MKLTLRKNLSGGIFAIVLGVVLRIMLPYNIKSKIHNVTSAVGPDYLPKIIIILMIACGAGLILQSLVFKKDQTVTIVLRDEFRPLVYMGMLVLYALLMPKIGFLVTSLIFAMLSMWVMESKNWRHYLYVAILVVAVWAGFRFGLGVPLP